MTHLTVSIPPDLLAWVQAQVDAGRYPDADSYLRDLIQHDRSDRSDAYDALEELMVDAERSGISSRSPQEVIDAARKSARMTENVGPDR